MALFSTTKIFIKGEPINLFNSLSLYQEIGHHHMLEISFRMDVFEGQFANVNNLFGARVSVEISASKKNSKEGSLEFVGTITQIKRAKTDFSGDSDEIIIVASSPTIVMDAGPNCRSFKDKKVSDVVKAVINDAGLKCKVAVTSTQHPYLVQHNESDFDYICRLATQYGKWWYYDGADLIFGKPGAKQVDLHYLNDLQEFNFSMVPQPADFKYIANDLGNKKQFSASGQRSNGMAPGLYKSKGNGLLTQASETPKSAFDDAITVQKEALEVNEMQFSGTSDNPDVKLGCKIKVEGIGARAGDGLYYVTKVAHSCNTIGNYENRFEAVSASKDTYPYTNIGVYPVTQNLVGYVVQTHEDPASMGRIKVRLPHHERYEEAWMRMVTPHSGNDWGITFLPEVGDEVLVGFEGGNAEHPIVLGSLYNNKDRIPGDVIVSENNYLKRISTKTKLSITFDDEKKVLTIETPGKNIFVLDDDAKCISMKDMNNNSIEMGPDGITINSSKDLILKAGTNLTQTANQAFSAKANASAELVASGATSIKGATVKIN